MSILRFIVATALVTAFMASLSWAAVFNTVSVFDPAGGDTITVNTTEADAFKVDVAAAYNNNAGGVVNFDNGSADDTFDFDFVFGTSQTKTLNTTTSIWAQTTTSGGFGNGTSPTQYFLVENPSNPGNPATNPNFTLTFDSVTGGAALEAVVRVGFALLDRRTNNPGDVTFTATWSDGNTEAINIAAATYEDDAVFIGFEAPAGLSIASISFATANAGAAPISTTNSTARIGIDDFGFVTAVIPEPASLALLGAGGLLMLARRR